MPVVVLFAMLGGALWATIPAILKVKRGVHEVITTIMFNSIVLALVNYLVNEPLSGLKGGTSLEPQTMTIQKSAVFHKINWIFGGLIPDYVYLDYSLIVAIILGVLVWILLYKLRQGFEIRSIGTALEASRYAGIRVDRVQVGAFLLSGAIAGCAGLQEIFAIREFYTYQIASGIGFDGIAIALVGRNSPVGVFFAALLFALLKQSGYGLQMFTKVPNSVIYVITGLMILIIVITNEIMVRYVQVLRKKEAS
ncbi:MAG: ABC transporter permease [Spirochaetes bacterium]|nr:ABC transporter permease [Spirochaetota bacterium]